MRLAVFETRDALMAATAERLAVALRDAIAQNGRACAALSGGSTPEPAYRLLAQTDIDWPRVTFLLVDERFVQLDNPASNEAMLRRALAPAFEAGAALLSMVGTSSTLEHAADAADALYGRQHIDIALMGMGEDGHTASWFPGVADEALRSPRTVVAIRAPNASGSPERLTLTRAAVAKADAIILLITGDAKRARLDAALREPIAQAPVAALFGDSTRPPEAFWSP